MARTAIFLGLGLGLVEANQYNVLFPLYNAPANCAPPISPIRSCLLSSVRAEIEDASPPCPCQAPGGTNCPADTPPPSRFATPLGPCSSWSHTGWGCHLFFCRRIRSPSACPEEPLLTPRTWIATRRHERLRQVGRHRVGRRHERHAGLRQWSLRERHRPGRPGAVKRP
jgi:hypothetical protein